MKSAALQAIEDGAARGQLLRSASPHTNAVLAEVARERARQEHLMSTGKFGFTCASRWAGDEFKLPILAEEVGEVAKELCDRKPGWKARLRTELIQLAAVCVAWAESLTEDAR